MITNCKTNKQTLVVVSHSRDETITKYIAKNESFLDFNIRIVTLQELLSEYEIFDEVNDKHILIKWYKKNTPCISNIDHILLNRVMYIPDELFNNFIKKDVEYATHELEAYIGFAFNGFKGVGNKFANGVCAKSTSLPQQWNVVRQKISINIPNYYWGPMSNNHLKNTTRVVYSQIYNFLNWSTTNYKKKIKAKQIFCFEKPIGEPVFICSIGHAQFITSEIDLSLDLQSRLKTITLQINQIFNHFISEILIFINGAQLTFGCINYEIVRSHKQKNFDSFVCDNLVSEILRCAS